MQVLHTNGRKQQIRELVTNLPYFSYNGLPCRLSEGGPLAFILTNDGEE